jgi:DNA-binding HxlR family transcriptional regulator
MRLDAVERACLHRIAGNVSNLLPPCASHTLLRLEALGLIERATTSWLPLEALHTSYRLTATGRAALAKR